MAVQDDNKLTANLKKNAFLSIFTDRTSCQHLIDSKALSFDKKKKLLMGEALNVIIDNPNRPFEKLAYYRLGNDKNMITYTKAIIYGDEGFPFGSPTFRFICKKIEEKIGDKNNQFLQDVAAGRIAI
jgi:hypothetical protein